MLNNLVCLSLVYAYYLKIGFDNHVYDRGYSIFAWCLGLVIISSLWVLRARWFCCVFRFSKFKSNILFILYDKFFSYYFILLLFSVAVGSFGPLNPVLLLFSSAIALIFLSDKKYAYDYFWERRAVEFLEVENPGDFSENEVVDMLFKQVLLHLGLFVVYFLFSLMFG